MRQGNSPDKNQLIQNLERIKALIEETIRLAGKGKKAARTSKKVQTSKSTAFDSARIDFTTPIRPFVKQYARELSGPKKFTLLIAYLSGGNLQKPVSTKDVRKLWSKMKGLLGFEFNTNYSTTAKDNDWVNAEKSGSYRLRPSWREIFK